MSIDSPQSSQEALGGHSASPAPKHPDMNEEGGLGAGSDSRMNNADSNKQKYITIIVICILIVLVGLVAGVMLWKPWESGKNEEDAPTGSTSVEGGGGDDLLGDGGEGEDTKKIVEASVDDGEIQELWGRFSSAFFDATGVTGVMLPHMPLQKFYTEEGALSPNGLADIYKVAVVLQRLYGKTQVCRGEYVSGTRSCLSGETIREMIEEYFGEDMDLAQFDNGKSQLGYPELNEVETLFLVNGEGWAYDTENDEMVLLASGATGVGTNRALVKAERDGERIYTYEVVGTVGCWQAAATGCNAYKIDGTEILDSADITVENMREHADLFDQFKMTFVKDGDDYVFEGMEKL